MNFKQHTYFVGKTPQKQKITTNMIEPTPREVSQRLCSRSFQFVCVRVRSWARESVFRYMWVRECAYIYIVFLLSAVHGGSTRVLSSAGFWCLRQSILLIRPVSRILVTFEQQIYIHTCEAKFKYWKCILLFFLLLLSVNENKRK